MGREGELSNPKKAPAAVAAKKLTPEEMNRLKANLFKPIKTEPKEKKAAKGPQEEPPKETKKLFGLF